MRSIKKNLTSTNSVIKHVVSSINNNKENSDPNVSHLIQNESQIGKHKTRHSRTNSIVSNFLMEKEFGSNNLVATGFISINETNNTFRFEEVASESSLQKEVSMETLVKLKNSDSQKNNLLQSIIDKKNLKSALNIEKINSEFEEDRKSGPHTEEQDSLDKFGYEDICNTSQGNASLKNTERQELRDDNILNVSDFGIDIVTTPKNEKENPEIYKRNRRNSGDNNFIPLKNSLSIKQPDNHTQSYLLALEGLISEYESTKDSITIPQKNYPNHIRLVSGKDIYIHSVIEEETDEILTDSALSIKKKSIFYSLSKSKQKQEEDRFINIIEEEESPVHLNLNRNNSKVSIDELHEKFSNLAKKITLEDCKIKNQMEEKKKRVMSIFFEDSLGQTDSQSLSDPSKKQSHGKNDSIPCVPFSNMSDQEYSMIKENYKNRQGKRSSIFKSEDLRITYSNKKDKKEEEIEVKDLEVTAKNNNGKFSNLQLENKISLVIPNKKASEIIIAKHNVNSISREIMINLEKNVEVAYAETKPLKAVPKEKGCIQNTSKTKCLGSSNQASNLIKRIVTSSSINSNNFNASQSAQAQFSKPLNNCAKDKLVGGKPPIATTNKHIVALRNIPAKK